MASYGSIPKLGELGCRRPHLAPLGAAFAAFGSSNARESWVGEALTLEGSIPPGLERALEQRLNDVIEHGYETVPLWEEDELQKLSGKCGVSLANLFETDAWMNAYRRKLLNSEFFCGHVRRMERAH